MTPPSNTIPPKLSATQAQALLHNLLASSNNTNHTNMPPNPNVHPQSHAQPQHRSGHTTIHSSPSPPGQPTTKTLHIDASTKLMGHLNNITLPSPSARTEDIEKVLKAVEPIYGPVADQTPGGDAANPSATNAGDSSQSGTGAGAGKGKAGANKQPNLNLSINAGISIAGSRNTIAFSNRRFPSPTSGPSEAEKPEQLHQHQHSPAHASSEEKGEQKEGWSTPSHSPFPNPAPFLNTGATVGPSDNGAGEAYAILKKISTLPSTTPSPSQNPTNPNTSLRDDLNRAFEEAVWRAAMVIFERKRKSDGLSDREGEGEKGRKLPKRERQSNEKCDVEVKTEGGEEEEEEEEEEERRG